MWWDAFANEFFEDDATLTLTFCLEDGPKRYSKRIIVDSNDSDTELWLLISCRTNADPAILPNDLRRRCQRVELPIEARQGVVPPDDHHAGL